MTLLPASNASGMQNAGLATQSLQAEIPWQKQLATAFRDAESLLRRLGLPDHPAIGCEFPLLVPHSFVDRMVCKDSADPLLLQVLTDERELTATPDFVADPVGDSAAKLTDGILQKYHGRALLITTGACAVHCRYCFRREYPYQNEPRRMQDWEPAIRQLEQDPSITEVILSGGDPLMLTDVRLRQMCERIDQIPHIERIRFHTRLPIVLPARVTDELLQTIAQLRSQAIMVVHANHGNEIAGDCSAALKKLVEAGIPVMNQAVLLRNINDDADALTDLCQRLINLGVMPYYLHQLDRVNGAAHFEVPVARGLQLIEELAKRLPGYAVPKFVQELPGQPSKSAIRM